MSKIIYGVIGVLVIAVVVLTGLVGFLYGQEPQTITVTTPTTTTATTTQPTQTTTQTTTITITSTSTYTSSQTQPNQYGIEATTETVNGSLIGIIRVSAPPGDIGLIVTDLKGEILDTIIIPNRAFLERALVWRQQFNPQNVKEDYYMFILQAQNGSELYRTTIKLPWEVFTPFEKLGISSAYAYSATLIVINVSNTGSSDATITDVFVNGKPAASFTPAGTLAPALPLPLASGASTTITLTFAAPGLVSGVTYDIKIHTASGNDYPKAVIIP